MRTVVLTSLAGIMLAAASPTLAAVTESNFVDLQGLSDEQTVYGTNNTGLLGSYAGISGGPTASAYAVTTDDYYKATAYQKLTYQFTVNVADLPGIAPGSDRASIPLIISYAGGVQTNSANSSAVVTLSVDNDIVGGLYDDNLSCGGTVGCSKSMSRSGAFDFAYSYDGGGGPIATTTGTVTLKAYALGQAGDTTPYGGRAAYAWIDPTISFDPAFLAQHPDATITTDSVTPAPEPGEWAMMAAGLGVVGGIARRRRRAA